MEANPLLFRDLAYIFVAALAGGILAWRLNLPLILGFVVGGMVISPFTPGLQVSDVHTFHEAAEAGAIPAITPSTRKGGTRTARHLAIELRIRRPMALPRSLASPSRT